MDRNCSLLWADVNCMPAAARLFLPRKWRALPDPAACSRAPQSASASLDCSMHPALPRGSNTHPASPPSSTASASLASPGVFTPVPMPPRCVARPLSTLSADRERSRRQDCRRLPLPPVTDDMSLRAREWRSSRDAHMSAPTMLGHLRSTPITAALVRGEVGTLGQMNSQLELPGDNEHCSLALLGDTRPSSAVVAAASLPHFSKAPSSLMSGNSGTLK
mmetsp:Transcript_17616/g.44884  ORF Transcript_17616/g.44884 Transcript_17616/m.44884 type:complete len:219 (+) Transcript_17616:127-783(+)